MEKDYPVQTVPPHADIDAAIDIFDRVNSLGTKLTDAELALTHITGKWSKARQVMKKKIYDLEKKGFSFDLTFMVRCLVGVVHGRALFEIIHKTNAPATNDLNTTNVLVPAVVYLAKYLDHQQAKGKPENQKNVFKTLAGFLNVEGGTLLIGVEDHGNVLGVEHCMEHKPQKMSEKDRDVFGLRFRNTLANYLSAEFNPYIHLSWAEHHKGTVATIKVDPSPKPVYFTDKKLQVTEFYIRAGNQTRLLDVETAHNYIGMHWEL